MSRLKSHEYTCPYFLSLPIQGAGTGNVEALSSYLSHQAELLSEWSHPYTGRLLKSVLDKDDLPKEDRIPGIGLRTCNGIGVMQERFAKAIREASNGKVNPDLMTLKPIEFLSDSLGHGLLRETMYWCPSCWKDDKDKGGIPYLRLYWTLQQTQTCAIHNERLIDLCPVCGAEKQLFPKFPRQHICDKCGHDLYVVTNTQIQQAKNITDEQIWFSHAIYNLIEKLSSSHYKITDSTLPRALRRLLNMTKISPTDLAKMLHVDLRMIKGLMDNSRRPYFPAFMDMCYRLDIPPDQFLFDKDNLTSPAQWKTYPQTGFVSTKRLLPATKKRILADLRKALKIKTGPPARVSHIASKYDVRYTTLRHNFPEEYRTLTQRRSAWERQFRKDAHQAKIENLTSGIFSLVRQGVYPSERKLRDLKYVKPSDLRREDIKLLLSTFQDIYKSLGFLND